MGSDNKCLIIKLNKVNKDISSVFQGFVCHKNNGHFLECEKIKPVLFNKMS